MSFIPHSRRIYNVNRHPVAIIVDITLKRRRIILIYPLFMKTWNKSDNIMLSNPPKECGIILLLGGRKYNNQNYCYNIERKCGE